MIMVINMKRNEEITNYYDDCKIDYEILWWLNIVWGMHYGYWDKYDFLLPKAILKMNQQIIDHTDINKNSYALDVGCGYSGTAMYIAKKIKCKIEGITIVDEQVKTSIKTIKRKKLDQYINVTNQDFHKTNFNDNTFDIVYGIESVCYADKEVFLKEAYRILKPGGTLIILDGFNTKNKKDFTDHENKIMGTMNKGWIIDSLETSDYFINTSKNIGFSSTEYTNITNKVKRTSIFMYICSFPAVIVDFLGRLIRIRTKYNKNNVVTARYQYKGIKNNLWEYGMFIAKK